MMKLFSAFVLTALFSNTLYAATPQLVCGESDLSCLRRSLLQKAEEVASMEREIGLLKSSVETLTQTNTLLRADNETVRAAIQPTLDAAKASQRYWWESPSFLIPVGAVIGIAITVFAIWGVGRLQTTLPYAHAMPAQ